MTGSSAHTKTTRSVMGRLPTAGAWLWQACREVYEPIVVFAATRFGLFLVAYLGLVLLPVHPGEGHWRAFPGNLFLDGWARWDSGWYFSIVERGYYRGPSPEPNNLPFFPLYPATIKALDFLLHNVALAGIVVSNLAFLLALVLLHRLVSGHFGKETAQRTILLLCVFPFAFFFSAAYSESLLLLLAVGTFYFGERRHWALASLCAMLASATRLVGLVAALALLLTYFKSANYDRRQIKLDAGWLLLSPLGLLGYLGFLHSRFGSPLAFADATVATWGLRSPLGFILNGEALGAFSRAGYLSGKFDFVTGAGVVTGAIFLLASLAGAWRLRFSYTAFALLVLLVPYAAANLDSMGRYVIVAFPVFIQVARLLRGGLMTQMALTVSALLLALCTVLFANWYWVG